jgi:hypothetical protein
VKELASSFVDNREFVAADSINQQTPPYAVRIGALVGESNISSVMGGFQTIT